jgi:menaquinone-9 beta-reductase
MIQTDVIIIGGGPAGSACAWRLKQLNINCLILEQRQFPRFKPCAGWITPEVLQDLGISPGDYTYGITSFKALHYSFRGFKFKLPTRQYAIRRIEFDDWLLERSGAPVEVHKASTITKNGDAFVVDNKFTAPHLIGAGGTYCPVFRTFFKPVSPRARESLIVSLEEEFPYDYTDQRCLLWFMENGLPGYAWYVPKANGYVNVGIGGKAQKLKSNKDDLKNHWNLLINKLKNEGLVRSHDYKPQAHTYYLRQRQPAVSRDNAYIIGDAVGLATLEMGEGIGPAIHSGLLAAEAIASGSEYSVESIPKYSLRSLVRVGH